jgi:hypothetical protein
MDSAFRVFYVSNCLIRNHVKDNQNSSESTRIKLRQNDPGFEYWKGQ